MHKEVLNRNEQRTSKVVKATEDCEACNVTKGDTCYGIILKVKSIAGHKFVPDVSNFMLEVFLEGFEDIESSWEPLKKLILECPVVAKAYAAKKNAEDHETLAKAMKRASAVQ
ncbi:hypothetical protein DYB26_006933 [Aphanomyces astaci]|uniref:Chromo domain-containing protein n=1 Tax=Aphanomyces astaci TaxID=112090 RepID=A0A397EYV6_APHAT|nr:hypothetical protein DYB31_011868 [Aphanomyces astaci]RHZ18877.1 hypothetical protein DYB26_006933 [Aphanomyces astaci]